MTQQQEREWVTWPPRRIRLLCRMLARSLRPSLPHCLTASLVRPLPSPAPEPHTHCLLFGTAFLALLFFDPPTSAGSFPPPPPCPSGFRVYLCGGHVLLASFHLLIARCVPRRSPLPTPSTSLSPIPPPWAPFSPNRIPPPLIVPLLLTGSICPAPSNMMKSSARTLVSLLFSLFLDLFPCHLRVHCRTPSC